MKQIILRLTTASLTFSIGVTCVGSHPATTLYRVHLIASREAVLRDDLFRMRRVIEQYAADTGSSPRSLGDLVKAGYLREIPVDSVTGRRDWAVVLGRDPNAHEDVRAVIDVRSASRQTSSKGTPYSQW